MPIYRPGDSINGTVTVFPDEDVNCKHLLIQLAWHTEGRGTRFEKKIDETDVFQGQLSGSMPRNFDFRFEIPKEPWSYEGTYINIVWEIVAKIDVSWARDPKDSVQFVVAPHRQEAADW